MAILMPPLLTLPEPSPKAVHRPLSQMLRAGSEGAHKDVERRLALPGSIANLADYRRCLLRFFQLYRPMETRFKHLSDWTDIGLHAPSCDLSSRLAADLSALGVCVADVQDAPPSALPPLHRFDQALGACYVIEGSALGSQFMLPQLQKTLGDQMTAADSFFRGRGPGTGAFWKEFRAALDLYGDRHPEQGSRVVDSAIATFEAIGIWMQP